jgi:hypothetical protein
LDHPNRLDSPELTRTIPTPQPLPFEIGGQHFEFQAYAIGAVPENAVVVPAAVSTGIEDTLNAYPEGTTPPRINTLYPGYASVPYTIMDPGARLDLTTPEGQAIYTEAEMNLLEHDRFTPPQWVRDIWEFVKIKRGKTFAFDTILACLRGVTWEDGKMTFTIGKGAYSQSFLSNSNEGLIVDLTEEERATASPRLIKLCDQLTARHGSGRTVQDIIFSACGNRLPEFQENIRNNNLGSAGIVLTNDGQLVFVLRGKQVTVNRGINCTASGATEFDYERLKSRRLQKYLADQLDRETTAELGMKGGDLLMGSMQQKIELELGFDETDYTLIPVGLLRELPRGGKCECMWLIRYDGTAEDVLKCITQNQNQERGEIDGLVYTLPLEDGRRLIRNPEGTNVIQHKGVVNLICIDQFLQNHPDMDPSIV